MGLKKTPVIFSPFDLPLCQLSVVVWDLSWGREALRSRLFDCHFSASSLSLSRRYLEVSSIKL